MRHPRIPVLLALTLLLLVLWPLASVLAQGPGASAPVWQAGKDLPLPLAVRLKVDPELLKQIERSASSPSDSPEAAGSQLAFLVYLAEQADLRPLAGISDKVERRRGIVATLQETAARSQRAVVAEIERQEAAGHVTASHAYWIFNGLAVTGDLHALIALASRPEVQALRADRTYSVPPAPPASEDLQSTDEESASPWSITKIGADLVWGSFGVTGEGIVVANLDTGVEYTHPALLTKYRGYQGDRSDHNYSWFDPTGTYPTVPNDGQGHGTHTMGTIVGGQTDGTHAIGVAPGAKWVAVKIFNDEGDSSSSIILRGFEWIMAPTNLLGGSPNPAKAPDIVSNSWGSEAGADTTFQQAVRALRAAGIFTVFAAGNEGPNPGTVSSPGSFPESFSVGAVDSSDAIAGFSSRGPSSWDDIKPEVVAPGVDIYSSIPGGKYQRGWNGTSMATPHVAGLVALLWQADRKYNAGSAQTAPASSGLNPTLTLTRTEEILLETARDLGTVGPENDFGWGLVDAYQAVRTVIPHGTFRGRVTDQSNGRGIAGALVTMAAREHGGLARTLTDAQGNYTFDVAAGSYDVSASHFYYYPQTVSQITVLQNTTTQLDLALVARPTGLLSGRVLAAETSQGLPARIEVLETEIVITTDAAGRYAATLPVGSYRLRVFAQEPGYRGALSDSFSMTAGGSVYRDFQLASAPTILLINADAWRQERPSRYYEQALKTNLYSYDVRDITNPPSDNPTTAQLAAYDIVIWSQPKTSPGYIEAWEALAGYLDGGGRLFITGQDIGYWDVERDSGNSYYRNYLHSSYVRDETGIEDLVGAPNGILQGLSFSLNVADSAQNQRFPSEIAPADSIALPVVSYVGDGYGGMQIDDCHFQVLYLAFGLEGVGPAAMRADIMARTLDWLQTARPELAVTMSPGELRGTGVMGSSVDYALTIVNSGHRVENFRLTTQGNQWPVALLDATGTQTISRVRLNSCAAVNLTVRVTIPVNASVGDSDAVVVRASSESDPTIQAQASLHTTAFPVWQPEAPAPGGRSRGAVTSAGRSIYVIGGEGSSGYLNSVDIFDPTSGIWRSGQAKPTRASNVSIAAIGNKVYAPGGYNDNPLSLLEVYDTTTDSWSTAAALPGPRYGHATVTLMGKLYVVGGYDANGYTASLLEYDPAANRWTEKAPMVHARAFVAAGVVNGKLYVAGGTDATADDLAYVEVYDPATNGWTAKQKLTTPRMGAAAVGAEGYLYVAGGGYSAQLASAERYDPTTDSWQTLPPLLHGRRTLGMALSCGNLYAISGWDGTYSAYNESLSIGSSLINSRLQVSEETAQAGTVLTYTISLLNHGATTLLAAGLRNPIPPHTTYVEGSATGGASYEPLTKAIVWSGTVPARSNKIIAFQVRIAADAPDGTVITDAVTIEDGLCGPYVKSKQTRVATPNLATSLKRGYPAQVASGETLRYVITVTNESLVKAGNLHLTDPLPPMLTYVPDSLRLSPNAGSASYNPTLNRIEWQGVVAAGHATNVAYEWTDSDSGGVGSNWIDSTGGTRLAGGDDVSLGPFPLGFSFSFFGQPYAQFYVNTNGQVLFGAGHSGYSNKAIPNSEEPNNWIAPFWDDLTCGATCLSYQTFGVAPQRYTVISWQGAGRYGSTDTYTFQVVLYESSNAILLQYQTMSGELADGDSATVGIENASGTEGVAYLHERIPTANAIHDGLAIRLAPPKPFLPGTQVIRFDARLAEDTPSNTAIVNSATLTDSVQHTHVLSATVEANVTDLSGSTKGVSKRWAMLGDVLEYTITLRNSGNLATRAVWTDTLPAEISYVPDSATGGAAYDAAQGRLTWHGQVPAGGALDLTFEGRIAMSWGSGQPITNHVEIADLIAGTKLTRQAVTTVYAADLSTSRKEVDKSVAAGGERLTYRIVLTNSAPVTAEQVVVRDPLPTQVTYVLDSATGGARYDPVQNVITWTGTISPADWLETSYTVSDSRQEPSLAHYEWIEIREHGQQLKLSDDDYAYVTLPFAFKFYGLPQSRLAVGSNGTLHFANSHPGRENLCLPYGEGEELAGLIAVFWDDLKPQLGGKIYYDVVGKAPFRRAVIEWDAVAYGNGDTVTGDTVTFQAILYENSHELLFQYQDVMTGDPAFDRGNSATIGIQANNRTGVNYSCSSPLLSDGLAVHMKALPQPSEHVLTFQVDVNGGLPLNTPIVNVATIAEHAALSREVSATTLANLVELRSSTKSVSPEAAGSGDVLTYTISLHNQGSSAAENARLVDPLPDGVAYVANSATGGASYNAAKRRIEWQGLVPGTQPAQAARVSDSDGDGVTFAWVDATGGAEIPGGDDATRGPFALPFPFRFFGQSYVEFHVNTNGQLLFGEGSSSYSNVLIPSSNKPDNFIAAHWDDLAMAETGSLYYRVVGSAPNRILAVEWHNVHRYSSTDPLTFEILLYESNQDIVLQYLTLPGPEEGLSATVGLENADGSQGLLYLYDGAPRANALHPQLAVRFQQARAESPGQQTLSFRVRINEGIAPNSEIINTAVISDGLGHTFTPTATLVINSVDLAQSSKTVDRPVATAGDVLSYTVTLRNTGTGAAPQVTLSDPLPAGTVYVPGSATAGASYDQEQNRISWRGPLAAGQSLPIRFAVTADPLAPNAAVITNTVWISDGLTSTITRSARTTMRAPDLSASEKSVEAKSALPGEIVTYTISVRNTSEVTATVEMTDALPAAVVYVPDTLWASSGEASYDAGQITWRGTVLAKGMAVVRFRARIASSAPSGSQIENSVIIRTGWAEAITRRAVLTVAQSGLRRYLPLLNKP